MQMSRASSQCHSVHQSRCGDVPEFFLVTQELPWEAFPGTAASGMQDLWGQGTGMGAPQVGHGQLHSI